MASKRLEEVEGMMDRAIQAKDHLKIKKGKHGLGRPTESSVRLKEVVEVMVEDPAAL